MNPVKIAFFDIDGTLIDMQTKTISKRTLEALAQLKQNGIKICIATGRPMKSVPVFPSITFDAFLTFNGSYCCSTEELIFKNPIPTLDVQKIIHNTKKIHRPIVLASTTRMGSNGRDQNLVEYFAISKQNVEILEDFDELAKEEVYQIMAGCCPEEYEAVLEDVSGASITAWWPRAVDIIPANGGKGVGVEKVLEYFHLNKEDAIAFGDGTNDIEMLQAVGRGIAMGNASEDVKEIADDICDCVAQDGIYTYCKQHHIL